jgi:hypothetical protein
MLRFIVHPTTLRILRIFAAVCSSIVALVTAFA